jgi:hypothetical protein
LNFAPLCKSSLLIERFFSPPPTVLIFFRFSLLEALEGGRGPIVVFVWRAAESVCAPPPRLYTLEKKERKKTFGKLIAGKKEMISRKKSVYNHHDEEREKNRSTDPYTDDEYTNIFKKEICRWNKLLELSADHFSKKKDGGPGRGSETRNKKINRFGTRKKVTSHEGMCSSGGLTNQ